MQRQEFFRKARQSAARELRDWISTCTPPERELFEEYYGAERLERLERLVSEPSPGSRLDRGASPENIVLIPGVMGSELSITSEIAEPQPIWVDLDNLFTNNGIDRLRLSADGITSAQAGVAVSAPAILTLYFDELEFSLLPEFNVRKFAYDWRKDIRSSARSLDKFLTTEFGREPVHIIAHSMGGLVARAMIAQRLASGAECTRVLGEGGRLVMLGTPNRGTYEALKILTGTQEAISVLALGLQAYSSFQSEFDDEVNKVLTVVHSLPACYQLLPAPVSHAGQSDLSIYDGSNYAELQESLSAAHFQAALEMHSLLETAVIPEVMRNVAGCDFSFETVTGADTSTPITNRTEYSISYSGDGVVAHASTALDDVPNYFVSGNHGELMSSSAVLRSIRTLLTAPASEVDLPTTPDGVLAKYLLGEGVGKPIRSEAPAPSISRNLTKGRLILEEIICERDGNGGGDTGRRMQAEFVRLLLSGWLG